MAWDFSTEPEFQAQLDWMDGFVRDEIEPLDVLWGAKTYHPLDDGSARDRRPAEAAGP